MSTTQSAATVGGPSKAARRWQMVGTYTALTIVTLITLAPFILALLTAFTSKAQFSAQGLSVPMPPTLDNFIALGDRRVDFAEAAWVTLAAVLVITVGQLLFSVMAAFAFARMRFPGRDLLFWLFLATLMVPQVVTVLPLYFMMSEVNQVGTFTGLVLPFILGSPYAVFLLREQFRQIPQELLDAMRMDGAGTLRILFGLVVPLSRPTLVTLMLITVVTHWNNFMWPLIIGRNRLFVITTATQSLQEQYANNTTLIMAASLLAMLPLIVLFVIFQKQIVRSIRISSFR
ncbi:carbohydrate ABC transporter permease [Gulosibacter bifidus]|uniref:Carbohydrate ABC transporter permease n=1 Tax=Gulosibacter bifidus TaxID=272239 RepID=A0ABW5RIX9_9MICO|nr:carbohydrate ABC transporter permease [Gulosibacter bifidus]